MCINSKVGRLSSTIGSVCLFHETTSIFIRLAELYWTGTIWVTCPAERTPAWHTQLGPRRNTLLHRIYVATILNFSRTVGLSTFSTTFGAEAQLADNTNKKYMLLSLSSDDQNFYRMHEYTRLVKRSGACCGRLLGLLISSSRCFCNARVFGFEKWKEAEQDTWILPVRTPAAVPLGAGSAARTSAYC